ncbi:hypothetical protein BJ944DRAFT_266937 [Cunninghamella echinulata]|nr:hypothetical protein BJ944DRAFT_266937 [Cunninghamella echinulata]
MIYIGMNGYVSKPVRKPELMAAINEFKQTIQVISQNNNIPNQKDSIDTSPIINECKDITSLKKEPTLDITPTPPTVTITPNLTNRGKDDIDSRRP